MRLPSLSWERLIGFRVAAPVVVVLALLVLATNEIGYEATERAAAQRDLAVVARSVVDRVRRGVLQMESAQRGYMLTGRVEYRQPYDTMRGEIRPALDSMRALAEEYRAQREALLQLAEASERKLSEMAELLRLFDKGDRETAMHLMLTDIGREQSERIHALVDEVSAREDEAYLQAGKRRERIRGWSRLASAAMVVLALATLYGGLRMHRQRVVERERYLAELSHERDKLESEVAQRTEELSSLARHLQTVREDERHRLARELHDELGALLTSAKLEVARVRKRAAAQPELLERIDTLGRTLDAGIGLKRRIVEDLRPSALDNLGLARTLEFLCKDFARRTELQLSLAIDDVRPSAEGALALYRLVQEALTNVGKYAQARRLHVRLSSVDGRAEVEVRDDGNGFDPQRVPAGRHGLSGMRFRVNSCGGRWQLQSAPGKGTTIKASLPL